MKIVALIGLLMIILGYTFIGTLLIGIYLMAVLFCSSYITTSDIVDDILVYLCVIEENNNRNP